MLDGRPNLVVGVMPPGFSILDKSVDVWSTVGFAPAARTPRGRWICVVGRVKDGVSMAQAQQDMARVHAELTRRFPGVQHRVDGATSCRCEQQLTGDVRPALWVMLGAVGFVLLIACANVGNLVLARATARQRELAVRAALGAGRGRLIRQMLAESVLLSLVGATAGLVLAWWAMVALRTTVAERLPIARLEQVGIDGKVLLFTVAAALVSAFIFGIAPALTSAGAETHRHAEGRRPLGVCRARRQGAQRVRRRRDGAGADPARRRRSAAAQLRHAAPRRPRLRSVADDDREGLDSAVEVHRTRRSSRRSSISCSSGSTRFPA